MLLVLAALTLASVVWPSWINLLSATVNTYPDSTVVSKLRVVGVIVKLADLPTVILFDCRLNIGTL